VTVDAAGNVIAAGRTANLETNFIETNFTVVKLDRTSGNILWLKALPTTNGGFNDVANAVGVDGTGNVVAAGAVRSASPYGDFTVIKSGDVVAAGSIPHNIGIHDDFIVVKFNGDTGAELWRRVIDGGSNEDDLAAAVTLDREANVIAAGTIRNVGSGADFIVVKLDRFTGAELWRRVVDGTESRDDGARAVAVDAAGNIVAAGFTQNTGTGSDFTVVKLRGIDGADFAPRPTLALTPLVIRVGGSITVAWSGIANPTPKDWIGLYKPGATNTEFIAWVYVSCSKERHHARSEGSCSLVVPAHLKPGKYEARLFANNGFIRLATSPVFTVVKDEPKRGK
jgi:hypothetical protein